MTQHYRFTPEVVYDYVEELDANLVSLFGNLFLRTFILFSRLHMYDHAYSLGLCYLSIRFSRPSHYHLLQTHLLPRLHRASDIRQSTMSYRPLSTHTSQSTRDRAAGETRQSILSRLNSMVKLTLKDAR